MIAKLLCTYLPVMLGIIFFVVELNKVFREGKQTLGHYSLYSVEINIAFGIFIIATLLSSNITLKATFACACAVICFMFYLPKLYKVALHEKDKFNSYLMTISATILYSLLSPILQLAL